MLYWMERSRGGSEALDVSKAEILRGIVTEKLSTAAQEILAVVERTVAGYEEEASGFRREIERQRRQLEVLLQPRVKLEKRDGHEVVVVSEEEEEEEGQAQQAGEEEEEEDTGSLGLLWYDDDDGGDEEQQSVRRAASKRQRREDLKDPDYEIKPSSRSDRRRPSRPRHSQNHLDLRICILDDSETDVLSKSVFQKCRVQELQCPRGLQEADFLDLLGSTFPQLASRTPFDVFTSDRSRRLQPLNVKTRTAEEIVRSIRQTGAGNSALYIRLKSEEDPPGSKGLHPVHKPDDSPSRSTTALAEQTQTSSSDLSERRRRGRPRLGEEPTHCFFKVCVLEGSQSDVLSNSVSVKSSTQELRCPRTLQEADFVDLLRSTFPQLAGDEKQLELFRSDRSRRLQRLPLTRLTPEEIYRTMRGSRADKMLLYIRLKKGEEELCVLRRNEAAADCPSAPVLIKSDKAELSSSSPVQHVEGWRTDVLFGTESSQEQDVETEEADGADVAESQEDCDDDWKPDPESLKARRRRGASGVEGRWAESSKACRVCGVWYRLQGSLIKHAWHHVDEPQHVCGICGRQFEAAEELKGHLRKYQKTHDCTYCGKSFLSATGLNAHTSLHTGNRQFRCDVCNKTFTYMSGLSVHRWVHTSEKPHKCDICPKAFGLKAQLVAHRKVHTGRERYLCNVCGKALYDLRSLTRHKSTHSGERRYGCQVCGKRFKLSNTLKSHEKIHTVRDRPYLCHICCKTFMSSSGLTAHVKTHSDDRPFICAVCSKGFISNGELRAHMRVHSGEAPYGCSECGRFFKRKTHLTNHVRSHLGIKLFMCGVCGKACSRQEHLTVHMRTHNGERPYQCTVCDKAFTQSHCLKTHMKSHRREDGPFQNAPTT